MQDESSQTKELTLAKNPSTSSEVLEKIARTRDINEVIKTFIARHPNVNAKTLIYLLRYDRVEMMGAIAAHPNTSPEILELMVRGSDKLYTQYKLAQNPNTPSDALAELCDETDSDDVRLALSQNPSTSLESLKSLFDESDLISIEAQKNYDIQETLDK